jgi:ABC-type amino acid transport/signal transduction systems, periplasmic component/domain
MKTPLQRRLYALTLTALCFFFTCAATASKTVFKLTTEENPPFNFTDEKTGKFVGIGTEMVKEIFERAHLKYKIVPLPWSRAYNLALQSANTCVFMTAFTPERVSLFKWIGPFTKVEWVVYGKAGTTVKVNSIDDLKSLRVGGYRDDAPVMFLQKREVKFDLVTSDGLNPRKLKEGRIDVWITNSTRGPLLAKKQGIEDFTKLYTIGVINHYLACNKQIEESAFNALNKAVKEIWSEGLLAKTANRYLHAEL